MNAGGAAVTRGLDVVIVNFHSERWIRTAIALAHEFGGEMTRVIMVDNSRETAPRMSLAQPAETPPSSPTQQIAAMRPQ